MSGPADANCPQCGGTGWTSVAGKTDVQRCNCFREARAGLRLERAGIPRRYRHCAMSNFETEFLNADPFIKVHGWSKFLCFVSAEITFQ